MALDNGPHNEQSETASLHLRSRWGEHSIKTLEDSLEFTGRNPNAIVLNLDLDCLQVRRNHFHFDSRVLGRILHGIVEHVRQRGRELVAIALNTQLLGLQTVQVPGDCTRVKMVSHAHQVHSVLHQRSNINVRF